MSSYQQHDPRAPVHHTGPTGAPGTGMTGAGLHQGQPQGHGQGVTEKMSGGGGVTDKLHRSGSSGSSSSEDDGQGGRRKKGMKEKIKEKMPGGGGVHKDQQSHDTATGTYGTEQHQEKKGMVDKIKEKLPGTH